MLIYLDANIVIYLVEQPPVWGAKTSLRLSALRGSGDQMIVSDLVRLESRVKPLAAGDSALVGRFDAYFASASVQVVPLTPAVCDRATAIRAVHRFKLGDALNLAAAVEHGCATFLTNDARLSHFPDLTVEILK